MFCSVDGCEKDTKAKGLCSKHLSRLYRHGDAEEVYNTYGMSLAEKLDYHSKLDPNTGCIEWQLALDRAGYARIEVDGKKLHVHRLTYELHHGEKIPEGLVIDHLCRNRKCRNINHLEVVTTRENILRGVGITAQQKAKTHCKNGHEFAGDNLIERNGRYGHKIRVCRTCANARVRASRQRGKNK